MSDDWRVRATLPHAGQAKELGDRLGKGDIEHTLDAGAADRVAVSVDGAEVFLYAGTRDQAQRALDAVSSLATQNSWSVQTELRHWHPTAEEWEDPDAPLPTDDAGQAAERQELFEHEREESQRLGIPEFEVRVECASHHETVALAERLAGEGIPSARRWRYLVVGADDEQAARQLADRLTSEAPAGCSVTVEGTPGAVLAETGGNPFAVFGGLGV